METESMFPCWPGIYAFSCNLSRGRFGHPVAFHERCEVSLDFIEIGLLGRNLLFQARDGILSDLLALKDRAVNFVHARIEMFAGLLQFALISFHLALQILKLARQIVKLFF